MTVRHLAAALTQTRRRLAVEVEYEETSMKIRTQADIEKLEQVPVTERIRHVSVADLLRRIEDVTRRIEEDDGAVARQVLLGKGAGVLGRGDREPMLPSELPYRGDAVGDRAVTKSRCLGEDQHPRFLRVRRAGNRDRGNEGEREGNEESVHGPICSGVMV